MPRWTCPRCDREFGKPNQSHTCVPGVTVDAAFDGRPPRLRALYDAIVAQLQGLGPVHEDAVSVGVFLKRDRKLAEVRPRSQDVSLALYLGLTLDEVRSALASLPDNRTPTQRDWQQLSNSWRPRIDAQIAMLERLRDRLGSCIGCGCLSMRGCRMLNPDDQAAQRGPGPRYVLDAD